METGPCFCMVNISPDGVPVAWNIPMLTWKRFDLHALK